MESNNNNNIIHILIISFSLTLFNSLQAVSRSNQKVDLSIPSSQNNHRPQSFSSSSQKYSTPVYSPFPEDSPIADDSSIPDDSSTPEDSPDDSPIPDNTSTAKNNPDAQDSPYPQDSTVASTIPPIKAPFKIDASKPAETDNPTIQEMCRVTDHPALCISALTADRIAENNHDHLEILGFAVKAMKLHTKMAMKMVSRAAMFPLPSIIASRLNDCLDIYDDAMTDLEDAVKALKARDVGTFSSLLSAVLDNYSTCDDGFGGAGNPLLDFDDQLIKMASNCLAMATFIK